MKTTDYAVCVAPDWSDQQHAFALQFTAANSKETGMITGFLEAGRNFVVHALAGHPWLDIYAPRKSCRESEWH
jgi:hypothetical protein